MSVKVPDECYKEFGADLDGCSTEEREGCGNCRLAKHVSDAPDLITEARELCEKATEGPWKAIERGNSVPSHSVVTVPYDGNPMINICSSISPKTENAEFIARSRTLVPELADALEKANADIKRLKTVQAEAISTLQKIEWVGSRAKGLIGDAIGILCGIEPESEEE